MSQTILLIIFLLIHTLSFSQIQVTAEDMPLENAVYKLETETNWSSSTSYVNTGADYLWDFTDATFSGWRNDTFVNVLSTPLVYNIVFNNPLDPDRRASIATPRNFAFPVPGVNVDNVFFFMQETPQQFSEVGFGAYFNNIPVPVKYDVPDVLYRFPVSYGTQDSTSTGFSLNLPGFGYYGQSKKRINTVDGWGNLHLPHASFPVVRIKSEIFYEDTLFNNQFGFGFTLFREETEYKWLSKDKGVPVLYVVESEFNVFVEAYDSMYFSIAGTDVVNKHKGFKLYPNPTSDFLYVSFNNNKKTDVLYALKDSHGRIVWENTKNAVPPGKTLDRINMSELNIKAGVYFLTIRAKDLFLIEKVAIL